MRDHRGCLTCLAFFIIFAVLAVILVPVAAWELSYGPLGLLPLALGASYGVIARHWLRRWLGRTVTRDGHGITIGREG